jgi:hypothetical protein
MSWKKIILAVILIAIVGGGWYGYKEYTRGVKDLSGVNADLRMSTPDLLNAYEKDQAQANAQFLDKVISVSGKVKKLEIDDKGDYTLVLGEANSLSSVRCSIDSAHQASAANLAEGSRVSVKGACTGFNSDELLGSDVVLNRCIIEKK